MSDASETSTREMEFLQLSFLKFEKKSIFASTEYVKESNSHYITISYLGGGKWKEERESYFFLSRQSYKTTL